MRIQWLPSRWKDWVQPHRLVPLLTILGAGIALVLSLLGVVPLSQADQIIIALLALLAIDALTERLSVLERVEKRLHEISTGQMLRKRSDIKTPIEQAREASEICMLVVHGTSVINPYLGFYETKLRDGCNLRIILLDPESSSVGMRQLLSKNQVTKPYIEANLDLLRPFLTLRTKGRCEVRLSPTFFPFALFAVDLSRPSGAMTVEYSSYKVSIDERPHVVLNKSDHPYWFSYYRQQFEQAWEDARIWEGEECKS